MKRILIVDDHSLIRAGLKQLMSAESDIEVIEAGNSAEAFSILRSKPVDIVVLDISMPGENGLDALKELNRKYPEIPVLILSVYPEDQYALRAFKLGASGYLTKDSAPDELLTAIRKILKGGQYASANIAKRLKESEGQHKKNISLDDLFDDLGLQEGIEWLIDDLQKKTEMEISLKMNFPDKMKPVDTEVGKTLLKVAHEAILNSIRHSNGTAIMVNVNQVTRELILDVIDNGIGIATDKVFSSKSYGLNNMRERIKGIYGQINIQGTKGKGTVIQVKIPL